MPAAVVDTYVGYIKDEEEEGGYEVAARRITDLQEFYSASAALLNCGEEEVAFVESASRGWALAFYSFPFKAGDRIITSAADYGSNFIGYLHARNRWGAEVVVIGDDEHGDLDLNMLRKNSAHPQARLICMSHIPTGGGRLIDACSIGVIANEFGLVFYLDACQSVGVIHCDVKEIGCHVLSATGRKFLRGPRGSGLLFIRNDLINLLEPCMLDQHGALLQSETSFSAVAGARRFEMWEYNCAAKAALAVAINYALHQHLASGKIERRVLCLGEYLRARLSSLPHVHLTDIGTNLCGIVTFIVDGFTAHALHEHLKKRGINSSVSGAASGGSRVWFDRRGLKELVRISPHYYNTQQELDAVIEALGHSKEALTHSIACRV